MTDRELLQQALEELLEVGGYTHTLIKDIQARLAQPELKNQCGKTCERAKLCAICAQELAQPEQEPLAITHEQSMRGYAIACKYGVLEKRAFDITEEMFHALYTAPQPAAQPEQEPRSILVYEWDEYNDSIYRSFHYQQRNGNYPHRAVTYYTAPQPAAQPVPLTDR